MHHRPQVLNFSSALNGFLQYKLAEGLSSSTVFNYERDLKLWLEHMGDQGIGKISSANLLEFLNYLRSEYVLCRIAGKEERKLSEKTIYNFYVSLSAFFTWAGIEFEMANPMKKAPDRAWRRMRRWNLSGGRRSSCRSRPATPALKPTRMIGACSPWCARTASATRPSC
ncbi:MAG: site-specific integrase [Anaerolineales bacterium]|jgi:integrase